MQSLSVQLYCFSLKANDYTLLSYAHSTSKSDAGLLRCGAASHAGRCIGTNVVLVEHAY